MGGDLSLTRVPLRPYWSATWACVRAHASRPCTAEAYTVSEKSAPCGKPFALFAREKSERRAREEREKSERRTREEREMAGFPAPKRYSWKRKIGRVDTAFIFYSRSRVSLVVVRYRATSSIVRPMRTRRDYFRNATPGYFNFSERSIWVAALVRWKSTPCFYRLRLSNPTPRHLAITFAAFCPCSIWQLVPQENATSSTKRLSVRNFFFILSPFSLHSLSIISLDRFESNGHRTRLR